MKLRLFFYLVVLFAFITFAPNQTTAQDKKVPQDSKKQMEEMMKEYMKYAEPGPAHKKLADMAGKWDCVVRMWMDPKSQPTESKGTTELKSIFGGRYSLMEHHGSFMGQPFDGMGITGYDNFKKQYNSMWIDSMGTAMFNSVGTADASGKVITYLGEMDDPVTGEKNKKIKSIERTIDKDKFVFEMYDTIPGQGEVKTLEITYTRQK